MFSAKLDTLLLSLRPASGVRPIPSARERARWNAMHYQYAGELDARAQQALNAQIPLLYYGDAVNFYKDGEALYREGRTVRRELLKALVLGYLAHDGDRFEFMARIADIVWAIAEEASWASPAHMATGRFLSEPFVDEDAADTAGLIATCRYLLDDNASGPLGYVFEYAARKVRQRVLEPFIGRDDWPFLRPQDFRAPRALEGILTAALLDEDAGSRWLCVRKTVQSLDHWMWTMPGDGGCVRTLEEHMQAVSSLDRCLWLLSRASAGEVEHRVDEQYRNMVHLPCVLHIGEGWFINGEEGSMRPVLAADELFQMGRSAADGALIGLAAYLNKRSTPRIPFEQSTPPLLGQAHRALISREFYETPARPPLYPSVNLPDMQLYTKRAHGFFAALRGGIEYQGAASGNVGNFTLFFRSEPVLVDITGAADTQYRNLPTIDGMGQMTGLSVASDAEFRDEGKYALLSMNIAGAYPKRADITAWQRSVMFMPFEERVRLIDVYDFDAMDHYVHFHFITPHKPILENSRARIGPVYIEWEMGLTPHVTRITLTGRSDVALFGTGVYQLTLKTENSSRSGNYTFVFQAI